MSLSVFYSSVCSCLCREFHTRVNEFKQKVFLFDRGKRESLFCALLVNKRTLH